MAGWKMAFCEICDVTLYSFRRLKVFGLLSNYAFVYSVLLGVTAILFSLSFFQGSPLGDDYVLLDKNRTKSIWEIPTSTWSNIFVHDRIEGALPSDMYRPIVDLTFWIDNRLMDMLEPVMHFSG